MTYAEQLRRQKAFDSAVASVELEGFTVPPEYLAEGQRFIKGEIEFPDLQHFVHEQATKPR